MAVQNQEVEPIAAGAINNAEAAAKKSPENNNLMFGGIVLILILVLGGSGYLFLQQLRSKQEGLDGALDKGDKRVLELTKQITTIQSQVATMEQKVATQDSQFERVISDHTDRNNEKLTQATGEMRESVQRLQRQLGKTRGDWLIADAEYLLSVANERLHLVGDVNTTLIALEAADQRLRESGDPGVFKVREALAAEVAVLKRIEMPDIVGLSSRLRVLESKTPNLPLFLPYLGKSSEEKDPATDNETDPQAQSESVVDVFLKDLKNLANDETTERPVNMLLLPKEADLIRQNLRLKLEMVRVALIQRNQQLYKENLNAVLEWLAQHFDPTADETKSVIEETQALRDTTLAVEFPEINDSLAMLRNVTKLRIEADKAVLPSSEDRDGGT